MKPYCCCVMDVRKGSTRTVARCSGLVSVYFMLICQILEVRCVVVEMLLLVTLLICQFPGVTLCSTCVCGVCIVCMHACMHANMHLLAL